MGQIIDKNFKKITEMRWNHENNRQNTTPEKHEMQFHYKIRNPNIETPNNVKWIKFKWPKHVSGTEAPGNGLGHSVIIGLGIVSNLDIRI